MSYCRFSEGDVYAYACDGGVQFWVAGNADKSLDRLCNTYNEAYQYAKELRDVHGLDVPSYAIEGLREDAIDEAERFFGPNGAVSWLRTENAELRQMVWVMRDCLADECKRCSEHGFPCEIDHDMQELGIGICDLATDGELGIEVVE